MLGWRWGRTWRPRRARVKIKMEMRIQMEMRTKMKTRVETAMEIALLRLYVETGIEVGTEVTVHMRMHTISKFRCNLKRLRSTWIQVQLQILTKMHMMMKTRMKLDMHMTTQAEMNTDEGAAWQSDEHEQYCEHKVGLDAEHCEEDGAGQHDETEVPVRGRGGLDNGDNGAWRVNWTRRRLCS